jgi:hypothetical protein
MLEQKQKKEVDMGLIGKLLSTPVRILNIPARCIEKLVDSDSELGDDDNILSTPLERLAESLDEIDEDDD